MDFGAEIPAAVVVVNLYDDNVAVAGHNLLGVTHPDALSKYRFRLEGTRWLDDSVVYDISVKPDSKYTSGFEGRVSVLGDVYALIDVELRPNADAFLFPDPVRKYRVTYRQQFSSFGKDFWLPVDFRAEAELKINFLGLLKLPTVHITMVSRFTDYIVNTAMPEELFADNDLFSVDSTAVDTDSIFMNAGLVVPLVQMEQRAYAEIDSTMRIHEAFPLRGPLARFVPDSDSDRERSLISRSFELMEFTPKVWFNRVDALHLGLGASMYPGKYVQLDGGGGWSSGLSGSDRWAWHSAVRLSSYGYPGAFFLEGRYEAENAMRYTSIYRNRMINSAATLFGVADYFDYYRREGYRITAGYMFDRRGVESELSISFLEEEHSSLALTTSYDVRGIKAPQRDNPAVPSGVLRAGRTSFVISNGGNMLTGRRRLEVVAERTIAGHDFDYTRYFVMADWRQRTFYRRRLLANTLDVRLMLGKSTGTLPLQRVFVVEGGLSLFRPYGTLRTRSGLPYEGDEALAVFWEHNFRTLFFEMMGWRSMVERGVNIIVFGGHTRTWVDTMEAGEDFVSPHDMESFHHEVGLSVSGLLGGMRIDLARRLGERQFTLGIGVAKLF